MRSINENVFKDQLNKVKDELFTVALALTGTLKFISIENWNSDELKQLANKWIALTDTRQKLELEILRNKYDPRRG